MKILFLFFCSLLASAFLYAQNAPGQQPPRHVRFRILKGDSAVMHFNKAYELIEDSCADIVRTTRYNPQTHKFSGAFKDVNNNNSSQLISEGVYSEDGLKNGIFTCYFFNGILQSKGQFVNNKPIGNWELFYETGKPQIVFYSENGVTKISDEWDEGGKKIVDKGNGWHTAKMGYFSWKGKLDNGLPEGAWQAYKTDDAAQTNVSEEHFKKGKFIKGNTLGTDYTDNSRIILIPDGMFPYTEAEKLHTSPINCNGIGHRHIVGARYPGGKEAYSELLRRAIHPVLKRLRIRAEYGAMLLIHGKVSESGNLVNLDTDNLFAHDLTRDLIEALRGLPALNPATAEGKPIKQGFVISLTFENGFVHYTYRFLPISQADVQGS